MWRKCSPSILNVGYKLQYFFLLPLFPVLILMSAIKEKNALHCSETKLVKKNKITKRKRDSRTDYRTNEKKESGWSRLESQLLLLLLVLLPTSSSTLPWLVQSFILLFFFYYFFLLLILLSPRGKTKKERLATCQWCKMKKNCDLSCYLWWWRKRRTAGKQCEMIHWAEIRRRKKSQPCN